MGESRSPPGRNYRAAIFDATSALIQRRQRRVYVQRPVCRCSNEWRIGLPLTGSVCFVKVFPGVTACIREQRRPFAPSFARTWLSRTEGQENIRVDVPEPGADRHNLCRTKFSPRRRSGFRSLIPRGKMGRLRNCDVALFLASDDRAFCEWGGLSVDGGFSAI